MGGETSLIGMSGSKVLGELEGRAFAIGWRLVQVLPEGAQIIGQIDTQRIPIYKESNVMISLPDIRQTKQGAKPTKIPTSMGHTQRTAQHDNGCPNSPTTTADHASPFV